MRNVFRVFARDVKRIAHVPAAWLVALFLIVLPSLYAWFNVVGFWNPYENTGNLRICVVNEDAGAHDDVLGDLDLGAQIVDQLKEDHQLGWDFVTREEAMQAVESGDAYAAFVIPQDFSSDMTTLLTGDFTAPKLEYYVNEKTGPVAPKITDTGATTLDTTVNDTFVSTASEAVAQGIDEWLGDSKADVQAAQSGALDRLDEAGDDVAAARSALDELAASAQEAQGKVDDAKRTLADAKAQAVLLSSALGDVSALTGDAAAGIVNFSTSMGSVLDQGSLLLSQSSAQANTAIGHTASGIVAASGDVDAAIARANAIVQENAQVADALDRVAQNLPDGEGKNALMQAATSLRNANGRAQQTLDGLSALSSDIADAASSASGASESVDAAVQGTLENADDFRATLANGTVPQLSAGLGQIGTAANGLASSVSGQVVLIDQTSSALDELKSTLQLSADALGQTDDLLAGIQSDFDTAATDITALGSSSAIEELFDGNLDPQNVADFMMSPTTVQTEKLYPLNAYGSAMAPLFINLTLWIGAFMLMVIMRIEVDGEGVPGIKPWQRYLGRWLLLAFMAALQAAVCVTGCLAIGVQTVSVPAFYLTAVGASLAYLSIQYALSSTLQHVGMGLCVVLVFIQIPAATGLYPIEMTTGFFQAVYPAFPFTYGINAMREVIGGFYDGAWLHDMGVLAAFFVAFMAIGLAARPYVANLNRLFARQLEESDLINSEAVQLPERRYRIAQIVRVLADRDEYRDAIKTRAMRFMRMYPRLKTAALVLGVAVPVVAMTALAVTQAEKVAMLTVLLVWLVLLVGFLIVVEYVRDSLTRQAALDTMSDDEVLSLYAAHGEMGEDRSTREKAAHRAAQDVGSSLARHAEGVRAGQSRGKHAVNQDESPKGGVR